MNKDDRDVLVGVTVGSFLIASMRFHLITSAEYSDICSACRWQVPQSVADRFGNNVIR